MGCGPNPSRFCAATNRCAPLRTTWPELPTFLSDSTDVCSPSEVLLLVISHWKISLRCWTLDIRDVRSRLVGKRTSRELYGQGSIGIGISERIGSRIASRWNCAAEPAGIRVPTHAGVTGMHGLMQDTPR